MPGTLIFGGTTEGRLAAEKEKGAVVCVSTAYGASLLPPGSDCRVGKLNRQEMAALMRELQPERVIDATHPFAVQVTANILACCEELGVPYERISRPAVPGDWKSHVRHAENAGQAAEMLKETEGHILLTTGSRTLGVYTAAVAAERIWARVLPTGEALELCEQAGIPASHVIAMQGPFSKELNGALYDQFDIRVMVTKDSGKAGGVEEKVLPALNREIEVILIDPPKAEIPGGEAGGKKS